jgi:phosphate/sulfate permease
LNQVRWLILREMLIAWILSVPTTMLRAAGTFDALSRG